MEAVAVGNQRWRDGLASYRPAEPIRTAEYEVAAIPGDVTAKAFVVGHHYSKSYPAARFRFGLYHRGALEGVAVFGVPMRQEVFRPLTGTYADTTELSRFVLLDEVPGNGETWFLARCFELLKAAGQTGVVSFADPVPRTTADGSKLFPGHVGTIYQAFNGVHVGRGTARTLHLLPDGRVFSDRAAQKIRKLERGWGYAAAQLEAFGASPMGGQDPHQWLREWTAKLTRPLKHPGNFKYAWALDRRGRRALPPSQPYPKKDFRVAA